MKKLVVFMLLMSGCASTQTILVKNCKDLGKGLYSCELLSEKAIRAK